MQTLISMIGKIQIHDLRFHYNKSLFLGKETRVLPARPPLPTNFTPPLPPTDDDNDDIDFSKPPTFAPPILKDSDSDSSSDVESFQVSQPISPALNKTEALRPPSIGVVHSFFFFQVLYKKDPKTLPVDLVSSLASCAQPHSLAAY